jgi:hypothetical protein
MNSELILKLRLLPRRMLTWVVAFFVPFPPEGQAVCVCCSFAGRWRMVYMPADQARQHMASHQGWRRTDMVRMKGRGPV